MTLVAPPRPPRKTNEPDPLEALIREARRRTRRRRLAYGALALLLMGAGIGTYFEVHGGHAARSGASYGPARTGVHRVVRALHNGPLTIMEVPTNDQAQGPAGWYDFSAIDGKGGLHPLVRCPQDSDWCGESVSAAWSPDGRRLALSVTSFGKPNPYNGLHVVTMATGDDRLLCSNCEPHLLAWSPDGTQLAFASEGNIYTVSADGSGLSVLNTRTPFGDTSPSWSPSGKFIAFASGRLHHKAIYVIGTDGAERSMVAAHGTAPAWSPLGTAIAYRVGCGIRLVTPTGKDVTPRTPGRCDAIGVSGPPVWSPDGQKIAVTGALNSPTGAVERGTWVMNADGSDLRRVTTKTLGVYVGDPARPAWRPVR